MREKELKDILQRRYSLNNWDDLLRMLFKKVELFNKPEALFNDDDKVVAGQQSGIIKLDDGKSLAIFEVEVNDSINIVRNRQGLREIAAKYIDQNITHGALVFFHNKNQLDYRFSFIAKWSSLDFETGELIKGETKPKRFTYIMGPNEACTTAAKRLLLLIGKREKGEVGIDELKEAFSVEALNKEFFKNYKHHYEKFWQFLADSEFQKLLVDPSKEDLEDQQKPIRDFVKKLLGRIVFLHFLQKKGWMGCAANSKSWENGKPRFMQMLFNDYQQKDKFYSKCLAKLFFETLNTKRPKEAFHINDLEGKLNGSRVPYLNGGLFDPEKNKETLKIDFPAPFFQELLEFFEQYNFTIDENSPDDHEVGIDPEMLGHIFENLLEENREKGAFYTPKEIVQYMCKESLIEYLSNTFSEKDEVEEFIRFHRVSSFFAERDNAKLLNEKLSDIKVCDPAIGSGAFPIGMLQEIFEAKRFIYPYLNTNEPFKPADVKKKIIQNSIYGVDLEKGAVDIAQLRFWLALVVEEVNPHPLPNLDYKIMQGNSLLEQYEGIDLSKTALLEAPTPKNITLFEEPETEYGFSEKNRESIKKLVKDYFKEEDKDEKARIHKAIDRIVLDHIDKSLEGFENQLLIEMATLEKRYRAKTDRLTENQIVQYSKTSKELKEIAKRQKQLENKGKARQNLLKFEETDERPYFLWHLYFMDVFEQGGFDVIIGNPPYIQIQKMDEVEKELLRSGGFQTFSSSGDIYCLFYEKGMNLLNEKATLAFITSNSWLKTKYGKALRGYFRTECNALKLLNFEDTKIFPSATVEVNIMLLQNSAFDNHLNICPLKSDYRIGNSIAKYFDDNSFSISKLDDNGWIISDEQTIKTKSIIEQVGIPLKDWDNEIYIGILNGFNDAYLITTETKGKIENEDPNSAELIKPILRGRDLKKYSYHWNDLWLINSHNGIKKAGIPRVNVESDYPSVYGHLLTFKDDLEIRNNKGDHWTNLRNCAYYPEFEKPKILWGELSDVPKFAYDDKGMFAEATLFALVGNHLKYLLSILNSNLALWYFNQITTTSGMGTSRWKKYKIEQIPIPKVSQETELKFENIASALIFINNPEYQPIIESVSQDSLNSVFEDLANMMVFEIYFEEEMKTNELDVLKFINEKTFPDISEMSPEEKKATTQKVYYELQEKNNPIRNRILVSSSRIETIARINAATN